MVVCHLKYLMHAHSMHGMRVQCAAARDHHQDCSGKKSQTCCGEENVPRSICRRLGTRKHRQWGMLSAASSNTQAMRLLGGAQCPAGPPHRLRALRANCAAAASSASWPDSSWAIAFACFSREGNPRLRTEPTAASLDVQNTCFPYCRQPNLTLFPAINILEL